MSILDEKRVEEAWGSFLKLAERLPLDVQAEAGHLARVLVDAEVAAERERLAATGACTMGDQAEILAREDCEREARQEPALAPLVRELDDARGVSRRREPDPSARPRVGGGRGLPCLLGGGDPPGRSPSERPGDLRGGHRRGGGRRSRKTIA